MLQAARDVARLPISPDRFSPVTSTCGRSSGKSTSGFARLRRWACRRGRKRLLSRPCHIVRVSLLLTLIDLIEFINPVEPSPLVINCSLCCSRLDIHVNEAISR